MKKALIITGALAIAGTGLYMWVKQPVVVINFNNKTGTGDVRIGNKTASFSAMQGVMIGTWNGYKIYVKGGTGEYAFTRYGKNIESATSITPYMGGSSYLTINHL